MRPGVDRGLAFGDAVEAGAHDRLAGRAAVADRRNDLGGGQFVERFDGVAPC
jgi:hypothetical protein